MKTGLVLEGGGMRGLYTIGVLDCFMDRDFKTDYVIGVSAGACNGVSYVSGQRGRSLRIDQNYLMDERYVSVKSFLKTGSMFGMDFIFDEIPHRLDLFDYEAFHKNPCEFVAGVTDAVTGKPFYFSKEAIQPGDSTVLRASSAIPVFSPIVEFRGGKYLDGGTSDPIPVRRALADGCDRLIVVLTRDRGYQKPPEKYRALYQHIFRKYPGMVEALDRRHEIYNETLNLIRQLERDGVATVIAPAAPMKIGRFEKDMNRLMAVYKDGMADAAAFLAKWNGESAVCAGKES
ncbi:MULTISPECIES: patatin-like phospholipase family protein [Anaerotruncus]|jgi:predicted patatin/cPLA2 family phospholipase|uniref:patatin-like phospholipase family protein n=1 Tax=Anaerotruncus TaxID=244127 RepID=UPI000835D513|nr:MULTISPECIES: patatin family protein [Anaerotruncus]RGX56981.1 patatin family protein [Anaerotruncus sp. AF02-27]